MIRLRTKSGRSMELSVDEVPFIELVNDLDGTVGQVIIQPEPGVLLIVEPNTESAERYEAMMAKHGVKFANMIIRKK